MRASEPRPRGVEDGSRRENPLNLPPIGNALVGRLRWTKKMGFCAPPPLSGFPVEQAMQYLSDSKHFVVSIMYICYSKSPTPPSHKHTLKFVFVQQEWESTYLCNIYLLRCKCIEWQFCKIETKA